MRKVLSQSKGSTGKENWRKKYTRRDLKVANELAGCIRKVEEFLFEKSANINFIGEPNGWGTKINFNTQDGEYDIYLPQLSEKIKESYIIFPQKMKLKEDLRKIFLSALHPIRHRIQNEKRVSFFDSQSFSNCNLLELIIKEVGKYQNEGLCLCSILQDPKTVNRREIDSLIVQHYAYTRQVMCAESNWKKFSEIDLWNISCDLMAEPL